MGLFPRVVYANGDGLKDLLVGDAEGRLILYLNINTDGDPRFDAGTPLEAGSTGSKTVIDVGQRPTPTVIDWDGDGARDILCGAKDGKLYLFINQGTDTSWDFRSGEAIQEDGADLVVPSLRASPHVADIDGDGRKDLLVGNTEGQILFYGNKGSDSAPVFSGYQLVEADGIPIDLSGTPRSRPFLCNWDGDCHDDLLVGAEDGRIRLYPGVPGTIAGMREYLPSVSASFMPAYPNPFNPSVTIPFETARSQRARITIFDPAGRLVRVLADRHFSAGAHQLYWKGRGSSGERLGSGVYFARLTAGTSISRQKLILIR
ncbi:MAG: T9SS type A sorting domain-containing protein [Candidatus Latescibacteria bacterium]|nr:T9SS type A sorting domain-containing protein [bacterium]MBD3423121.1 T9SS type A sorting domain-containing protein [Candidatus Latescibacterota bacterium]